MDKRLQIVRFTMLMIFCLIFCQFLPGQETGRTDDHVYIVSGDYNYPPYEYLNEKNEPEGYVVDMMRAVAKTANIRIDIQLKPWTEARRALENREIDILEGMFYSQAREINLDFSKPHTIVIHAIFVRTDYTTIQSPRDFVGKEVIVQKGDIMHDYLIVRKIDCKIITVENPTQALDLLAAGKHDCALLSELQSLSYIKLKKITNLTVAGAPFFDARYCFAVAEGDSVLLKRLDEGLRIVKATGEYSKIYNHWFGKTDSGKLKTLLFYTLLVLIASIIVILFLIYFWTLILKRKVKKDTTDLRKEISDRQKIEDKLAEEKILLRSVIDSIPDEIYFKDVHNRFILVNQTVLKNHGFTSNEEIVGKTDFDLYPSEQAKYFWEEEQAVFRTTKPVLNVESSYMGKNNKLEWVSTSKIQMKNSQGETVGLVGVNRLVTDRKLAEEEILRARKIESLGVLAGGIAHDFNNILTIILGNISLSKSLIDPNINIVKYLTNAEIASLRARDLTQKLLTFSKGGQPIRKPLAIGHLLQETVKFALSGSKARSVFSIPSDLWTVEV
ncbi:MAG: transporter substrate-binding domain-containing protein, partial [Candidatus Neomarinimicrobiota bacterium]